MQPNNYTFIKPVNQFAGLINEKANLLYERLLKLDISDTDIDEFGKYYFNNHHRGSRLFFSIQSSADIIFNGTALTGKSPDETSFIDYGAGLGTLFLLAGMVGFKKVYFNDYFPQWAGFAKIICDKLSIPIDDFISGDIDAVIDYGKKNNTTFDIVASRNVVEHIYRLRNFYTKLYESDLAVVCYSTTTANYHNPAMRLKHYLYHNKAEKSIYINQRTAYINELVPNISKTDLTALVDITRGRAFDDFTAAVKLYFEKKPISPVEFLGTNTCDCKTGVWAENLISKQNYKDIIEKSGFGVTYSAGFWDTHYRFLPLNFVTGILNFIIKLSGKKGYWFSPFVNIIAIKKNNG